MAGYETYSDDTSDGVTDMIKERVSRYLPYIEKNKPVSNDTYATFLPSGDQDGEIIGSELLKRVCSFAPSESANIKRYLDLISFDLISFT